jgi:hypothetical protein
MEFGPQFSAVREFARGTDDVWLLLGCVAAVLAHDVAIEHGWRPLDRVPRAIRWGGYIAMTLFILSVGREALSDFIYFQF